MSLASLFFIIIILILAFQLAPRPRLDARPRTSKVPQLPLSDLSDWLEQQEEMVPDIIPSARANIQWADPKSPTKTQYCFLYLHGFSASWRETAPVTERLAQHHDANVVQARLAGHGLRYQGMQASAEDWLASVTDHFDIASRLGDQVIIVATSTGAPLALWLITQFSQKIHSCLFLSPNFRIRNPFGFLFTWPWSKHWIAYLLGKQITWEATSTEEGECWTHQYSTLALIEMQKIVDWAHKQHLEAIQTPVAMVYMINDPKVYPPAAISMFDRWGARSKQLIRVTLDGNAAEHVFAGDITCPHRVDWTLDHLKSFLTPLINK